MIMFVKFWWKCVKIFISLYHSGIIWCELSRVSSNTDSQYWCACLQRCYSWTLLYTGTVYTVEIFGDDRKRSSHTRHADLGYSTWWRFSLIVKCFQILIDSCFISLWIGLGSEADVKLFPRKRLQNTFSW